MVGILRCSVIAFIAITLTNVQAQRLTGKQSFGARGIARTTAETMAQPAARRQHKHYRFKRERDIPGRKNRPQNPAAPAESRWIVPAIGSGVFRSIPASRNAALLAAP